MYPVHEGFVVVAHHVVRLEIPDVLLSLLLQFVEEFLLCGVLLVHLGLDAGVVLVVREMRVFEEKNRHIRVGVTHDAEELLPLFPDEVIVGVRDVVENKDCRVLDGGHQFGYFQVEQGVAAEAQVDNLAVEAA